MNRTVILCAHGSHSPRGRAMLAGLVNAVRRELPDLEVVDAFVDVQDPSIEDAVRETSGPRAIVPLMPVLDAPVAAEIARAARLDASVVVTAPIGPDWVLAEVGVRRLIEAGARLGDTILLAAGQVADAAAMTEVSRAAQLLSAVWGGRVHVGTLSGTDVPLADALDVARAYGRRIVISPYLLAPGRELDAISAAGADVVTSPLLDAKAPDPRLVELIATRARTRTDALHA